MIHPNRNDDATVSLKAYDAQGELVDTMNTFSRMSPEIQYIEFADKARREYKAVRIIMEVAYLLLVCIFLSSGVAGASDGSVQGFCRSGDCNPFTGFRSIDVHLEKEMWPAEKVEAIPYTEINISDYLDGWYDMFAWQLTKTVMDNAIMETPITPVWIQVMVALILILGLLSAGAYAMMALREDENLRRRNDLDV